MTGQRKLNYVQILFPAVVAHWSKNHHKQENIHNLGPSKTVIQNSLLFVLVSVYALPRKVWFYGQDMFVFCHETQRSHDWPTFSRHRPVLISSQTNTTTTTNVFIFFRLTHDISLDEFEDEDLSEITEITDERGLSLNCNGLDIKVRERFLSYACSLSC